MKKISADWVFPVSAAPIPEGVVVLDDAGKVLALDSRRQHDPASLDIRKGVLVPGFINTHCHLELSHMKGKVHTGTGLIPFITEVVTQRHAPAEVIASAVEAAEAEMLAAGIVAVGDISNTTDTFPVKSRGRLQYYTFVELFDFLQDSGADKAFQDWKPIFNQVPTPPGHRKSVVPHAPYSVSRALFQKINQHNPHFGATVSIHNQETPPENELFLKKKGAFIDFYKKFGISLNTFRATRKTSIFYALEHLNPANRTLFVHNTLTTREEIMAAHAWSQHVYWATCPNANLYIENRLPNYRCFIDTHARLTIGTDSLTSNWQLSVLEEMKTIARYQSYVPFELMLRWATLHGAQALGFDDTLGSLDVGKTPGVLLLQNLSQGKLTPHTTVLRLA